VLSVEDHGDGIPPADLEAVFDPFFRSARTANRAGIGVGLSVCRRLIEAMDGKIWAEAAEDGGARFSLSLPISDGPAEDD
jgi:signal transduction histidine kinase